MTTGRDAAWTDPVRGRSGALTTRALNAAGVVVVGYWSVRTGLADGAAPWVWVTVAVALAAWTTRVVARSERVLIAATWVMVATGSVVVPPTGSVAVAVPLVGVVLVSATRLLPVWAGPLTATASIVTIAASALATGGDVRVVLGAAAGVVLAAAVGFGRRQLRIAEERTRQAEREQQRAELLADRSRAAREVHDVLAHSLGGLVLQLDAVEALLEAGRVEEATRRAADARTLAASGLAEARRAVHALREDQPTDPPAPPADLPALVAAHRAFGGAVTTHGDQGLAAVDAAHRRVVVAATREALSNARTHAPGRPVMLSVDRDGSAVRVTVANPTDTAGARPEADGHGLVGMRERFAELGDDSTVTAGPVDGVFVVTMRVPAAPVAAVREREARR